MSNREFIRNMIILVIAILLIILIYVVDYNNTTIEQEEENRINRIETRLNEQMNYIHGLEADVDNLYRVVE